MVVSLGPGKFYGTSLPRPRIYADVKFNNERVDPPVPVTDPLMSWANEAHWSMGGLSFKRLRLQGKIEGNVEKLRAEREKLFRKQNRGVATVGRSDLTGSKSPASVSPLPVLAMTKRRRFMAMIENEEEDEDEEVVEIGEEKESLEIGNRRVRRRLVKKLGDEFDKVASESERSDVSDSGNKFESESTMKGSGEGSDSIAARTRRSRRKEKNDDVDAAVKVVEGVNKSNSKGRKLKAGKNSKSQGEESPVSGGGVRTSRRLAKRESS